MGSLRSIVLAGAAAFVMIPGAFAADLGPIAPPPLPRVQAPVEDFTSGWYLRGDVGVGSQQFKDFGHNQTNPGFVWPASWRIDQRDIKDTAFVGFGGGYQWNNWLRTDFTGEYRASTKVKAIGSFIEFCPGGRCFDVYDADHQASVFLANVYADLGTWWCLTPFVGVGVGGARHNVAAIHDLGVISNGTVGFGLADQDHVPWTFAWALHAGLAYNVSNLPVDDADPSAHGPSPGRAQATASRLLDNLSANTAAAWYGGTIAGSAPDGISYELAFGAFKGQVTPGKPNLSSAPLPPNFLINEVSLNPSGPAIPTFNSSK